jgi:hypothetical protein
LHLGHSEFDAQFACQGIRRKYFRQWRRSFQHDHRPFAQFRLQTHHSLHGKIRDEETRKGHVDTNGAGSP